MNNNKIYVNGPLNNISPGLSKKSFSPGYVGKFLGENADAVAFLNVQSPIVGNVDPTNPKKTTTNSSIAMSVVHLLVIPKVYKYNAVTLKNTDIPMLKSMKRLGLKVAKKLVAEIRDIPELVLGKSKKIVENRSATNKNDSAFLTGFHVWPSHSTGHLHMHVVYKPWKSTSYNKQIQDKLITTENLINALGGLNNNSSNGSMSIDAFNTRKAKFINLLIDDVNNKNLKMKKLASIPNNNLKNVTKGLIMGNYKNKTAVLPHLAGFKPSPLNANTRAQLNKTRTKLYSHLTGNKNVYLKTLPYSAYTNKLQK